MNRPLRYPLLFNPNARGQKGKKALKFIMKNAARFALYATNDEAEAVELAAEFAKKGEAVVIAAGGDGTLNAVIQGLKGSETALGIFPSGTMNVFARELGIPVPGMNNMPLRKALDVIDENHTKKVDMFSVNGRAFIQMAGVGFDAQIIEETDPDLKKILGPMIYLASAVKVLGAEPPKMQLKTDEGKVYEGAAILVGNGGYYGGQVKLFSKAQNDDKLLDFIIFKESGYRFIVDVLAGMSSVEMNSNTNIEYVQARSAEIVSDREIPLQVDGELIGRSDRFSFQREAKCLKVRAPSSPHTTLFKELIEKVVTGIS